MSNRARIKKLERRRQALIRVLLDTNQMIRGSFGTVYRKCGKSNCWCAEGGGHPVNRITWTEKTLSRTKAIPAEDVDWIGTMVNNYKYFRKNRQALRALEKKINTAVDALEAKTVDVTKRKKDYLK